MSRSTRITYDRAADAVAIIFAPRPDGRPLTKDLGHGVSADFIGKQLVGFEILGASALIPPAALETIGAAGEELSLKQAAKEAKRQPQTLRKAIERGAIIGAEKRGRDWVMTRAALFNYLESLAPAGRPTKNKRAPHRKRALTRGRT